MSKVSNDHLKKCISDVVAGAEENKRYSLRRRLQVGDKWAQKTVPALARLSVSSVITAGVSACVGVGRGAIRSTTIQFGWRRHGALLKWEKAAWRRQHGWRRVSSSDGASRPPQTSNSRPHPALLRYTY